MFSALAVALCFAMAALWARSYFAADAAVLTRGTHTLTAQSAAGGLAFVRAPVEGRAQPVLQPADRFRGTFTFAAWQTPEGGWAVAFPHWVVCALGLVPAAWLLLRRKWHEFEALPPSNCINCGELLREVGMCPKCHTPAGGFIS